MLSQLEHVEVIGEAQNGYEAIDLFKEHQPDLIMMDISMPGMTGLDAIKEIRAQDSENTKIIMISSLNQKKMVFYALAEGANHFIVKPFTTELIFDAIEKVFKAPEPEIIDIDNPPTID